MRLIAFPNEFQKWCCRFGIHNCTRLAQNSTPTNGEDSTPANTTVFAGQSTLGRATLLIQLLGLLGAARVRISGAVHRSNDDIFFRIYVRMASLLL
jgi:putative ribosome biogenesis GTPase RsgA